MESDFKWNPAVQWNINKTLPASLQNWLYNLFSHSLYPHLQTLQPLDVTLWCRLGKSVSSLWGYNSFEDASSPDGQHWNDITLKFLNPDLLVTETLVLLHEVREGVFFLKRERISVDFTLDGVGWEIRVYCLQWTRLRALHFFFSYSRKIWIFSTQSRHSTGLFLYISLYSETRCQRPSIWW